jgi:hypothetical protein
METPGINNDTFKLVFNEKWHQKGDILEGSHNFKMLIVKVNKITWWDRLLFKLGFKIESCTGVIVKDINEIENDYLHFKFLQKYNLI